MKNIFNLLIVSSICFGAVGCGKLKLPSPKIKWKASKESEQAAKCALADSTNSMFRELEADYDIKLYQETILKVIEDLRSKEDTNDKNFWTKLSPEVRDHLNYELNLYLLNNPGPDSTSVYQSTAHFFSGVKTGFNEKLNYKIKDSFGQIYTFKARSAETLSSYIFNFECGKFKQTDLSGYVVGEEVNKVDDIISAVECRSTGESILMMEMKKNLYIKAGEKLHLASALELNKKLKKRTSEFSIKNSHVDMKIKIKNRRVKLINEWEGNKSQMSFTSIDQDFDSEGACKILR